MIQPLPVLPEPADSWGSSEKEKTTSSGWGNCEPANKLDDDWGTEKPADKKTEEKPQMAPVPILQNKPPEGRVVNESLDPRKATKKRISMADYKKRKSEIEAPRKDPEECSNSEKEADVVLIEPEVKDQEISPAEETKVNDFFGA